MRKYLCIFSVAISILPLNLRAQSTPNVSAYVSSPRRALVAPELPEIGEPWTSNSLLWADAMLAAFPPALTEAPDRRPVLQRLDDIFHMQSAPQRQSVRTFLRRRMGAALLQMEQGDATGAPTRVWKLYNAGFVVRSGGVTVGFDLIPGVPDSVCVMSEEQLARLVAQVDVLFISHWHPDHANRQMAEFFLKAGKPVIVPPGLWSDQPIAKNLTYPDRSPNRTFPVTVNHRSISVVAYPGHQGTVLNNVYFVRFPNGFGALHTGDQDLPSGQGGDRGWLENIGNQHHVNILLVDSWYANLSALIASVSPDVVIPGHENELRHEVPHREGYDQTYERLFHSSRPFVVMAWGESLRLAH
jgi:glyoxylase-like metal-dependent hydrolase (beta-lactamase superfamily II)